MGVTVEWFFFSVLKLYPCCFASPENYAVYQFFGVCCVWINSKYNFCCLILQHGWTALHKAACHGDSDCVKVLLDGGASIDIKNDVRSTSQLQLDVGASKPQSPLNECCIVMNHCLISEFHNACALVVVAAVCVMTPSSHQVQHKCIAKCAVHPIIASSTTREASAVGHSQVRGPRPKNIMFTLTPSNHPFLVQLDHTAVSVLNMAVQQGASTAQSTGHSLDTDQTKALDWRSAVQFLFTLARCSVPRPIDLTAWVWVRASQSKVYVQCCLPRRQYTSQGWWGACCLLRTGMVF